MYMGVQIVKKSQDLLQKKEVNRPLSIKYYKILENFSHICDIGTEIEGQQNRIKRRWKQVYRYMDPRLTINFSLQCKGK